MFAGGGEQRLEERLVGAGCRPSGSSRGRRPAARWPRRSRRPWRRPPRPCRPSRSARAASALAFAAAFCAVGRRGRAGVGLGRDRDDPGVARLGRRRLRHQAGVDVLGGRADPLRRRRASPGASASMSRSSVFGATSAGSAGRGSAAAVCACASVSRPAGAPSRMRLSASLDAGSARRVAVLEFVLRDRLAVDAPDRGEVRVVPGQAGGDEQDEDGGHDDEAEAEVGVEVPPVLALPLRPVGALDDGFGSKGHGVADPVEWRGRSLRGRRGAGIVPQRPRRGQSAADAAVIRRIVRGRPGRR